MSRNRAHATSDHLRRGAVSHLLPAIVITAAIAALVGMSVPPMLQTINANAHLQQCATNQAQIARALFTYRDQFDGKWPWVDLKGIDLNETSKYNFHFTVRGFERLHNLLPDAAPNAIFYCPGAQRGVGTSPAKSGDGLSTRLSGGDEWGWQRNDDAVRMPFAWDWSAPAKDSRIKRILLADRSPQNHGGDTVIAVYADGSFSSLPVVSVAEVRGSTEGRNITVTQGYDGESLSGSTSHKDKDLPGDGAVVYNPQIAPQILDGEIEQAPDNIYDLHQDILDPQNELPQKVGGGSLGRTWLR